MKVVKLSLAILGLIIVVAALAIGSFLFFMDPNQLKPVIIAEVQKKTGYQLTIDGKLSWSFFPRLSVYIDRMTLTAPRQTMPFVELRQIKMATDPTQLIYGKQQLQGNIRIAYVKYMNVKAQDMNVSVQWQNNKLTLNPLFAKLYDGTLRGQARGSLFSTTPQWDFNILLERIEFGSLLKDLDRENKINISGIGQVSLQAETQGINKEQLLKNLNGNSTFSLDQGVLQGIDLNYFVESANALLNKATPPMPPVGEPQTMFNRLTGTMRIQNGVTKTDDLLLTSPSFTTKAQGDIDLVNQAVNYQLQVTPSAQQKINWIVPVTVFGNLARPSVRLDMIMLEGMIAKEQFKKIKSKIQEEAKKLPEKINRFLQNL